MTRYIKFHITAFWVKGINYYAVESGYSKDKKRIEHLVKKLNKKVRVKV